MLSKMTMSDKILICLILIISVAWLVLTVLFYSSEEAKIIEISIYGDLIEKVALTKDTEDIYSFEFGENTGYIEVKDGAIRMLEMDKKICPDEICSLTGWIKEEYETIVCMPNGIIVNIKENIDSNQDIDIIIA